MMRTNFLFQVSIAALTVAWAGTAMAQQVPQVPPSATDTGVPPQAAGDSGAADAGNMPDIIVTAQKTAESASKTPIALSVFTGNTLQERGVQSVSDLRNIAPSLEIGSAAHGPNIAIRGVSNTDPTSKGEQGVSFNVDNIPIGRPQIMGLALFDLDRVEVLRGPQGTLYGRSSTGGAINVITAKPKTDALDAAGSFELGNYETRRGQAMVNIPITDNLAFRAAGSFNLRDGYLKPVLGTMNTLNTQSALNDENNRTGRFSLLYKIADRGSIVLTTTIGHVGGTGDVSSALYQRVLDDSSGAASRNVFYNPMAGFLNDDYQIYNGELNLDFGPVHVAYDGAHIWFRTRDNYAPSTNNPFAAAMQGTYNWSDYRSVNKYDVHEVRLSNADPSRFSWIVGANSYVENIYEQDTNWQTVDTAAPTLAAQYNTVSPQIVGTTHHKSRGVFGQASYNVTEQLKLTAGARYSDDSMYRDSSFVNGPCFNAAGIQVGPGNICFPDPTQGDHGQQAEKKVTWKVGVDYQITPSQLLYGSVSTGYKPGSFNDYNPANPNGTGGTVAYGAEELTAYEIGFKGRILPHLQYNTAVYYYDYSKYQLTGATYAGSFTCNGPCITIYTTLVPVRMKGWENEINWTPTPNDSLSLFATLEEGHYVNAKAGFIYNRQIDFSGKRLDNLPKFVLNGSYDHHFQLASGGFISARVSSKYSSGYLNTDFAGNAVIAPFPGFVPFYTVNPAQYKQKAFTRSDAQIGYTTASGKLTVEGFVRNIEDKLQFLSNPQGLGQGAGANPINPDYVVARVSAPRTYGVRVSLRY